MKLEALHAHVEKLLERITGITELSTDDEGNWLNFPFKRSVVYVRCVDHDAPRVFVFGVAAVDVPKSAELFLTLNEINSQLRYSRCYWGDGSVYVEMEHLGETLDFEELENLFYAIGRTADHFGPLIVEEHGGHTPLDGESGSKADPPAAEKGTGLYL